MTDAELQAIRDKLAKATPGPWQPHPRSVYQDVEGDEMGGLGFDVDGPPEPQLRGQFSRGADANFIAHAPEDIAALLEEVDRLRDIVNRLGPSIVDLAEEVVLTAEKIADSLEKKKEAK